MKRNMKALGLALVAAFAMSVVAASAAQANFTQPGNEYPVAVTGHPEGGVENNYFQLLGEGGQTHCEEVTYEATLSEETTELTVTPHYTGCILTAGGVEIVLSVNLNGCHYKFFIEEKTETGGKGSAEIVCPEGELIEATTSLCDVEVPPQKAGGITFTDLENGNITIDLDATEEITYEEIKTSIFAPCESHHAGTGSAVSTIVVAGYEDLGTHHWITEDSDGGETTLETLTEGNPLDIDVGL